MFRLAKKNLTLWSKSFSSNSNTKRLPTTYQKKFLATVPPNKSEEVKRINIEFKNEYNGDVKLIRENIPRHDYQFWQKKTEKFERVIRILGILFLIGLIVVWITVEPEEEHWVDKMMREKAEKDAEYRKKIQEEYIKNKK